MSGHDAAIAAMNALMGPIIGITLVLMAVFLPASFLPGLTGQMYAQFALVIAATALISAINAATLKPTQCALWLRRPVPPEQRNFFYRGFNAVYHRFENALRGPNRRRWFTTAARWFCIALAIIGAARLRNVARRDRLPADRGSGLSCSLPYSFPTAPRSAERRSRWTEVETHRQRRPGRRARHHHRRHIGPRQQRFARQCRRRLYHAEGLELARHGPGPCIAFQDSQRKAGRHRGRQRPRAAASTDPGHRQCRRLHYADRAARRQFRSRQSSESRDERHGAGRQHAVEHPACIDDVSCQRASIQGR